MSDELQIILDMLAASLRRTGSLDRAVAETKRFINPAQTHLVDKAAEHIQAKIDQIERMKEPPALAERASSGWYEGPRDTDRLWPSYRAHLQHVRKLAPAAVNSIDQATSRILSFMQHPATLSFSARGLVLGYVQSGKTTNFTGLAAKAIDAGYKGVIVLSGVHNVLRRQTELRLVADLVSLAPEAFMRLTSDTSDFQGNPNAVAILKGPQAAIAVVKKNASVLSKLVSWIRSAGIASQAFPTLIIDDEADQASLNAARNPEERTRIYDLVMQLLGALPKAAYVGYTATPFGNVLADPSIPEGLYPKDFIVDLPAPEGYFGAESIFGREPLPGDDPAEVSGGLNMMRSVSVEDAASLRPGAKRRHAFQAQLVPSLREAIEYFWLATACRVARGQGDKHSSMLVHTTQYAAVHPKICAALRDHGEVVKAGLSASDSILLTELKKHWDEEQNQLPPESMGEARVSFDALLPHLHDVISRSVFVVENAESWKRLDYSGEDRIHIVVGGNVLSRGLTLEGLVVSYFVRSASAYDTLLQMGRWFGYRFGYSDLPRIWLTDELRGYFYDLATVEREMRLDVARYEDEGLTPKQAGVRVRTHPALAITAAAKMAAAIDAYVSYGGRRVQTILFNYHDSDWLTKNLNAGAALTSSLDNWRTSSDGGRHICINAPVAHVLRFFEDYQIHERSRDLNSELLLRYVRTKVEQGQLLNWSVVIVGLTPAPGRRRRVLGNTETTLVGRSRLKSIGSQSYASIGALTSPIDILGDLDPIPASARKKSTDVLLAERSPQQTPLLLLYLIDQYSVPSENNKDSRAPLEAAEDMLGIAVVCPELDGDLGVSYKVAPVNVRDEEQEVEPMELPDDLDAV